MRNTVLDHPLRLLKAITLPLVIFRIWPSSWSYFEDIEAIVGVPFGSHASNGTPGASNRGIARVMVDLRKRFPQAKLIAQWEIADALRELGVEPDIETGDRGNPHITTRHFFTTVLTRNRKLVKIAAVAHPDHLRRVVWTAERLGFKVAIPNANSIPYDPDSTQVWCRSKWKLPFSTNPRNWGFFWWERVAMAVFALKGWI